MTRRARYPSDTSDEQWGLIEPLLPPVNTGGRPEKHSRRAIVDAILYVVRTGCAWRQLPADFPPWQTVYWYFVRWEQAKATEKILRVVREQLRLQEGRNREPSAGLIDSQSVKGADTVGRDTRGNGAGKKVNGRKRFIGTDTLGLLLTVVVLSAAVQDRDGAKPALLQAYLLTPARFVFADGGFAGRLLDWAQTLPRTTLHIVRKPAGQRGFAVIPRRGGPCVGSGVVAVAVVRSVVRPSVRVRVRGITGNQPTRSPVTPGSVVGPPPSATP